jgi:hypothetical protein
MKPYDSRHATLDPGLTALALRAMHERDGLYPFVERFQRGGPRRRPRPARTPSRPAPAGQSAPFWPRSLRAADLFPTLVRLRRPGRTPSAAA